MPLPYETDLEEIKVRIRKSIKNPNVGRSWQAVLKDGPRAFRLATLSEILNPKTGDLHHHALRLDSIGRQRKEGWFFQPERSISLEGRDPDEIDRLCSFLQAHREGKLEAASELHIIKGEEYDKLSRLIDLIPKLASPDMVELVKLVIPRIDASQHYLGEFIQAFSESDPATVEYFSVATQLVKHQRAFDQLKEMVETGSASEQDYQTLLAKNAWMFGSEYSELLDRRTWTRDDNLDYMLRRTSDNYLEIVEIKTPFREPLLLHDKSHDSFYASSRLSPVIGQVIRYISEAERDRDRIRSKDGLDVLKVRARIIVGRDGAPEQNEALRNLNGHLHRIEVLTFDQLVRIAGRVLNVFQAKVDTPASTSDAGLNDVEPF